ncbi:MAG: amidase [Dehalococcoidia bacterium]
MDTFIGRIEALNPTLNAFLTVTADAARREAREAEAALARGDELPPLHGVPIAVKDLEATKGVRTTSGSLVYRDFVPTEDSIIVERLRRAGVIILGKTNTPEFGQSTTTENRLGDDCRNPWDPTRTTGGSSGGSGAALAAGLCPIATGSDGGGSIRIPSSFCGVYGIKPTHGRVPSAEGSWPLFSDSGPMARSVRDAALMLSLVSGHDARDPLAIRGKPPDFLAALDGDLKGLRVAWSPDLGYAAVDEGVLATVRSAVDLFQDFGCAVEEAIPGTGEPFGIFATIVLAEGYAELGHLLEKHSDDLMRYVRSAIEHGQKVTGADYARAMRELWVFRARMEDFFEDYDLLLTPTTAVPAFPLGRRPTMIAGQEVSKLWGATPFTPGFNMTGNPAANVPCGFSSEGLPIGLHIVGRWGEEVTVLRASAALEQARPWAKAIPPLAAL